MKWQRARNVSGSTGFLFWVETGRPALVDGVSEFDETHKSSANAYRTNLLSADGSRLYADTETVELIAFFAAEVPIVDLRTELVAQGFTETGHRPGAQPRETLST